LSIRGSHRSKAGQAENHRSGENVSTEHSKMKWIQAIWFHGFMEWSEMGNSGQTGGEDTENG
jgi:hypothetical protein